MDPKDTEQGAVTERVEPDRAVGNAQRQMHRLAPRNPAPRSSAALPAAIRDA
jgi:hypothetical protein